jgi:hypothetical protein
MDFSAFRFIDNHRIECEKCGWCSWAVIKQKNRGGAWQFRYMCQGCEYMVPKYLKKSDVVAAGLDPEEMPISGARNTCEVCGNDGAQNHHWAPYAFFGNEADNWPQSFLCIDCHSRWHKIVTPHINP